MASSQAAATDAPPPYELVAQQQRAYEKATSIPNNSHSTLSHNDPRSSSQQSLVPADDDHQQDRRRLLLIYLHGFMGNETSFRSFPAHVHDLLAVVLAETHVVHTKIYPRYRSKGNISIARDNFSKWLEPHESGSTDVVLLGHSMGGLLGAEVVLMPSSRPSSRPLNHSILGTINFDVPFLGMHPGVVKSGLSSIFKPAEDPHDENIDESHQTGSPGPASSHSGTDSFWSTDQTDPNYNPAFTNDVVLPTRKGWRGAWHFINKHSDDLVQSTKKLVSSHLEFGGAMANYGELKTRYARIRALEEKDPRIRQSVVDGSTPRVRFINYYTASTGRPKKPKLPPRTPSTSVTEHPDGDALQTSSHDAQTDNENWESAMESLTISAPEQADSDNVGKSDSDSLHLTELPPKPPPLGDLSYIQDEQIRKLVEREHEKAVKAYSKAVESRSHAHQHYNEPETTPETQSKGKKKTADIPAQKTESEMSHSEREKLRLEREKQRMEAESRRMRGEKSADPARPVQGSDLRPDAGSRTTSTAARSPSDGSTRQDDLTLTPKNSRQGSAVVAPVKKDRKFCLLPPKDSSGQRDPCWVRVFMKDVDEVGAHCGLFFVDERYEQLVGDVAERIEGWVKEGRKG